jgi:hypothetical protein
MLGQAIITCLQKFKDVMNIKKIVLSGNCPVKKGTQNSLNFCGLIHLFVFSPM